VSVLQGYPPEWTEEAIKNSSPPARQTPCRPYQPLHDAYGYGNLGNEVDASNAEPSEDDAGEENSDIHINTPSRKASEIIRFQSAQPAPKNEIVTRPTIPADASDAASDTPSAIPSVTAAADITCNDSGLVTKSCITGDTVGDSDQVNNCSDSLQCAVNHTEGTSEESTITESDSVCNSVTLDYNRGLPSFLRLSPVVSTKQCVYVDGDTICPLDILCNSYDRHRMSPYSMTGIDNYPYDPGGYIQCRTWISFDTRNSLLTNCLRV
jgi:hypothetical protein